MIARGLAAACIAATALFAPSCATAPAVRRAYSGPERAPGELAVLVVPYQLDVVSVNGNRGFGTPLFSTARSTELQLAPGPHDVSLRFYSPAGDPDDGSDGIYRSPPASLRVDLEAGRRYRAEYTYNTENRNEPALRVWVEAEDGTEPAPTDAGETPALRDLKSRWNDAGEEDRRMFREWIRR